MEVRALLGAMPGLLNSFKFCMPSTTCSQDLIGYAKGRRLKGGPASTSSVRCHVNSMWNKVLPLQP
jgi:hypothetical protein